VQGEATTTARMPVKKDSKDSFLTLAIIDPVDFQKLNYS
jgi:hypothetical protein